jgi:hypothetical protein
MTSAKQDHVTKTQLYEKWHHVGAVVVDVAALLDALAYVKPKGDFPDFQQKQWADLQRTIPKVCAHALMSILDTLNDECNNYVAADEAA